jgi:hypothetical protein
LFLNLGPSLALSVGGYANAGELIRQHRPEGVAVPFLRNINGRKLSQELIRNHIFKARGRLTTRFVFSKDLAELLVAFAD